jgi:hypothetical protein
MTPPAAVSANAAPAPGIPPPAATGTAGDAPHQPTPVDPRLRLNLHVFGLSYHPDREGTRTSHLDNEVNAGLGLNYQYHNDARGVASIEAGFYKDSGSNWAKFAGTGYQFKLGKSWLLGADLLAVQSPTYNKGDAFIAPIPRLTYDFGPVKVNAIYIPKIDPVNLYAVFAIYLTVPLGHW